MDPRTYAVIGAGPVGGILGAHLASIGEEVIFVDLLEDHLRAIKERGLTITGVHELTAPCLETCTSILDLRKFKGIHAAFISLKTPVMCGLLPALKRELAPETRIVSAQNGLENENFIAQFFGEERVFRIVINYAGVLQENGRIWMSFFNAPNYIGALSPSEAPFAEWLADKLTEADLETSFTTDIRKYEWKKTILNASLSPPCALTQKTMKEVMDLPVGEHLVRELLREAIEVSQAEGCQWEDGFLDTCLAYLHKGGYHKVSMHVDIEMGNRTEIEFLNDRIIAYGKRHNIQTPFHIALSDLIKGLEKESVVPEESAHMSNLEKEKDQMADEQDNAGVTSYKKFKWCDMSCEHAEFPDKEHLDGSGTCRTFIALFCKKLGKIVTKNAPCVAIHGARRPSAHF